MKLTDFGLSKIILEGFNNLYLIWFFNQDGDKSYSLCGTPEYLAPEILTSSIE